MVIIGSWFDSLFLEVVAGFTAKVNYAQ